jgi:WD40 repeat protein
MALKNPSLRGWLFGLLMLGLLSACDPAPNNVPPLQRSVVPTLAAPAYRESAAPITLDNIEEIALLGRLDQPDTVSTLFQHTVSPDGTRLAGINNEELLAWDLLSGRLAFNTARLEATHTLYSPDKTEIYALNNPGEVVVYDAETGAERNAFLAHDRYANVFAYDPINGTVAFGGTDGTIRVWDMLERQALVEIQAHTTPPTAMAFSPDGSRLISASAAEAKVWDWANRTPLDELQLDNIPVYRIAYAPDGQRVALGGETDVRLWSLADSGGALRLASPPGGVSQILTYSPDGAYLVGGNNVGGLQVWSSNNAGLVGFLPIQGTQISADFAPFASLLLTSTLDGDVSLWNLAAADGETIPRAELPTAGTRVFAADWTDDSRLILLFDAGGPVYVWGIGE